MEENYEDMMENLVDNIKDGSIVPIIGMGAYVIHDESEADKKITVTQYVIKKILAKNGIEFNSLEKEDVDILKKGGFQGMTILHKILKRRNLSLVPLLNKVFSKEKEHIRLNTDIKDFLVRGNFPLILSTCPFNYLEDEILEESGMRYKIITYQGEKKQDLPEGNFQPTMFFLFNIVNNKENIVITDNFLLQFMHHYCDSGKRPPNLINHLKNKRILSLGCDIPDWTVRFLLCSLKGEDTRKNCYGVLKNEFIGGILPVRKENNRDLTMFLTRISYFSSEDMTEFVRRINTSLPLKKELPKIFLSLSSEEYDSIGVKVVDILKSHFNVWLFNNDGDVQYWKEIREAIAECEYFMPVITDKSTNIVHENRIWFSNAELAQDRAKGLIAEWQWALKNMRDKNLKYHYCIPLAVGKNYQGFTANAINIKDPNDEFIRPLFCSKDGTQAIEVKTINELNPEMVLKYTNK